MRIAPGKIAIRPFGDEVDDGGVLYADERKSLKGEVVAVGTPQPGVFTPARMILYYLFGIHPIKKGTIVAIPKVVTPINGLMIFWQSEINVYDLE